MPTQTFNNWPDPVINQKCIDQIDQNEPSRRSRHIRKYSIIYFAGKLIKMLILTAAFLTIMAAIGNSIELIARL
jgi:hypothetical protein